MNYCWQEQTERARRPRESAKAEGGRVRGALVGAEKASETLSKRKMEKR